MHPIMIARYLLPAAIRMQAHWAQHPRSILTLANDNGLIANLWKLHKPLVPLYLLYNTRP